MSVAIETVYALENVPSFERQTGFIVSRKNGIIVSKTKLKKTEW